MDRRSDCLRRQVDVELKRVKIRGELLGINCKTLRRGGSPAFTGRVESETPAANVSLRLTRELSNLSTR